MKRSNLLAVGVASLVSLVGTAHATLTAEATAALGDITTAATDMEAGVWPIIGAVVVAVISIKLFKRFSNKV